MKPASNVNNYSAIDFSNSKIDVNKKFSSNEKRKHQLVYLAQKAIKSNQK